MIQFSPGSYLGLWNLMHLAELNSAKQPVPNEILKADSGRHSGSLSQYLSAAEFVQQICICSIWLPCYLLQELTVEFNFSKNNKPQ